MKKLMLALLLTLAVVPLAPADGLPPGLARVRQAAERGDAEAQLNLGTLYQYGFHMKGNEIPALAWYMLSAAQGNAQARQRRDALMRHLSQADVAKARQLSEQLAKEIAGEKAKSEAPAAPAPGPQAPTSQGPASQAPAP